MDIILIIVAICITIGFADRYYSPKKRIERLWNEIHMHAVEIGRYKDDPHMHSFSEAMRKPKMDAAGNLINALLDYYCPRQDDDEDANEYYFNNRY